MKKFLLCVIKLIAILFFTGGTNFYSWLIYRNDAVYSYSGGNGLLSTPYYELNVFYGLKGLVILVFSSFAGYYLFNEYIFNNCNKNVTKIISLIVFCVVLFIINFIVGLCAYGFISFYFENQFLDFINVIIFNAWIFMPILYFTVKLVKIIIVRLIKVKEKYKHE